MFKRGVTRTCFTEQRLGIDLNPLKSDCGGISTVYHRLSLDLDSGGSTGHKKQRNAVCVIGGPCASGRYQYQVSHMPIGNKEFAAGNPETPFGWLCCGGD